MIDSMQEQEQALTPLLVVGLEASQLAIICGFHSNFKHVGDETNESDLQQLSTRTRSREPRTFNTIGKSYERRGSR